MRGNLGRGNVPGNVGHPRDAADDRSGDANGRRIHRALTSAGSIELGEDLDEAAVTARDVTVGFNQTRTWRRRLEHAEKRFGAANIAADNHLMVCPSNWTSGRAVVAAG